MPNAVDGDDAVRAMRAASSVLQKWWPEATDSPRSWKGIRWGAGRVRKLDLSRSGLEVLPPQIGQLKALTSLNLRGCPLKELPPQIGQLTALTQLWLQGCLLRKLPPQIGQLTALTYLDLTSCPLKELPPQIGQLKALAMLNLEKCLLKELPPEFGQLQALSILFLDGCEQLTLTPGAEQYGQSASTIVAAYARLLIVEPRKDTPGELHALLLANPLWAPPFFKTILTDAAHADWLGKAVTANPQLANLTDSIGRRAIDIAHPACKQAMQAALEARAPSESTAGASNEMETLRAELKAAREEAMAAGAAREKAEASAACCTPYSTRTPARPVFHMPVMVLCVMLSGSFPSFIQRALCCGNYTEQAELQAELHKKATPTAAGCCSIL